MNEILPVPLTCKAGVVTRHRPDFQLEVVEVPVPVPGPNEILIRLNATGICYSDIHYMLEDLPLPRMGDYGVRSPGHEGAGVVVMVGSQVKNWKIGDRAGIKPTWDTCMACELCWGSHECHCPQAIPTGLKVPGTYQQYIVSPARYASPIPDRVDDYCAGPIMCSGSTIYRSIVESGVRPGNWIAILGAGGGVGHMGVQLAKAMGLRIIGVDSGESKRNLCLDLGCEAFVDISTTKEMASEVRRLSSGQGVDAVFVTATSASAYRAATSMVRVGGRVMCVGMPASGTAIAGDDPMILILNNIKIIGTLTGSLKDTHEALEFAARGLLKPVYQVFSLADLPEVVSSLRLGNVTGRCVIDFNA
ncbi:hypothetical protein PFICI_04323 [Pestalotiopsis fici W106-1]|uniref:Enoyl reductase (ER) domain-containing protein n=1 Tax=Pestalotiopsis fici (strain W106-1 / CGMCC3.15140) TaxID=1229662 RepID=W3XAK3_PESFW|nr:uncharacterized protein PFICI_04323 [Pestalotiopsis fici W106-1]ETS82447.1 hypothetical protein PFICI_04323 [Pestalotiopsis fici W106-1]